MRKAMLLVALTAVVCLAACDTFALRSGSQNGAEWRCTPLPPDFQEVDLIGKWEHLHHRGNQLDLHKDGTCIQTYENRVTGLFFTSECTWSLEKKWGGLYLDNVARPLTAREIAPKGLYLDNGARTTQQASGVGNSRGLKPADKSSATTNHKWATDQSCGPR
jgi:hypothetical protein